MNKQVTFDFGEHGICKPDENGLYEGFFDSSDAGVTEPEAIRQWLCSSLTVDTQGPDWPYIERLVELAESAATWEAEARDNLRNGAESIKQHRSCSKTSQASRRNYEPSRRPRIWRLQRMQRIPVLVVPGKR
jgi:hypothetical protein